MNDKCKKEIIEGITQKQLEKYLNKINWKLQDVGCGYLRIINHKGNHCGFEMHNGSDALSDSPYAAKHLFGGYHSGSLHIKLDSIRLTYFEEKGSIPWISLSIVGADKNSFFISFYNHDDESLII